MVFNEVELEPRIVVHGIEIDGEFKQDVLAAIAMKDLPHTVQIHKSKHREAETWCRENLGPRWEALGNREGNWCCFWAGPRVKFQGYNYYFASERDAVIVSLKFS
jgi:hypothetical protein